MNEHYWEYPDWMTRDQQKCWRLVCDLYGGETKPVIAIGSGTTENGNKTHGEFHVQWREGYLESLPEGPVELASTVSAGVEYRFSVCRVGDVADKEV